MSMNDKEIDSLCRLSVDRLTNWSIELTSKCNLRCTYCSVPHSETYGDQHISEARLNKLKNMMNGRQVTTLSLSGRGELTYIENWQEMVEPFLRTGVATHTVTNLAKPMTWEECVCLARFTSLTFSIDTVDREVTKKVRKGEDLRTVLYNIDMIKAAATYLGKDHLPFHVIAVVTKSNIFGLKKLACLMVAIGARGLNLQDLVIDYSQNVETVDIQHIKHLSRAELQRATQEVNECGEILAKNNIGFSVYESLVNVLNQACGGEARDLKDVKITEGVYGEHVRHGLELLEGETRDCNHPFHLGLFLADGGVEPCTGAYGPITSIDLADDIDQVFNAPSWTDLRRKLITGNLDTACRFCPSKKPIKIEDFQEKIKTFIGAAARSE